MTGDDHLTSIQVGPLPISNGTTIQELAYWYNGVGGAHVPFNARPEDAPRRAAYYPLIIEVMSSIADITADLVDMVYYGPDDPRSTAFSFTTNPYSKDGSYCQIWIPWRRNRLAYFDQPSDLYTSFDVSGSDPSLYKLRMIVYNLVVYHSVEEFRTAYESGQITKVPPPAKDDSFLHKDRLGPVRDLENRLAPTMVELEGKRYKIDEGNGYVEYLGWSFYHRFTRDTGIGIFDIKFKGERILYELGLQDAAAQYSGNNPFQAATAYYDRYYGIGTSNVRLVPGFDCPYHATYLNNTWNDELGVHEIINGMCIFETDLGHPYSRHNDPTYIQSSKASGLTVRWIATVGNYDYLFDYSFWIDGTIAVDARASGYIQANYYRPSDGGHWGPRVQETITGTLHTHVMNIKADFDIINTNNTFLKTDIIVENITAPWFPELGEFEMMRFNFTELQTEDEGLLSVPTNGQTMYTIINKDQKNKWGESRGYRILPGMSNVHLASQRSPFTLKSGQWAKQAFAVSRQHDTEPSSSSTQQQNLPMAPPVEFWKFFDGESLVQEDLVMWINLGMHHYTRSEDIPNTIMTEAHSSVMFAPQNWGDTELAVDLTNAIIYHANENGSVVVPNDNGVRPPSCFPLTAQDELIGVFENQSPWRYPGTGSIGKKKWTPGR
jgi:primary-amine oxidase